MVEKVSGAKLCIEDGPRRPGDAAQLVAESSKIKNVLEWKPKHGVLDVICATAYQWEAKLQGVPSKKQGNVSERSA